MSRRQHTTLTYSLQVNLPAGKTQAAFTEWLIATIVSIVGSCIIKLTDKKVTYL